MSQLGTYNFKSIETITGDDGTAIYPVASNINILGAAGITTSGDLVTGTITISTVGPGPAAGEFLTDIDWPVVPDALNQISIGGDPGDNITTDGTTPHRIRIRVSGTTDHAIQVGNAAGALTSLGLGTTGTVLTGVTGADPAFSATPTVTTIYATTFDTNVAAAGLTLSGTTLSADGTDANISIALTPKGTGVVTSSNGFTASNGDIITSAGNISSSGTITAGTTAYATTFDTNVAAAKLQIAGTGISAAGTDANVGISLTPKGTSDVTIASNDLIMTSGNIDIGTTSATAGSILASSNRVFHTFGSNNLFVGELSGNYTLTVLNSDHNTGLGGYTLTSLTTGAYNLALGHGAGSTLTSGSYNLHLGITAGGAASVDSSSNIYIGNFGDTESHVMRIGTHGTGDGEQDTCYIAGINGAAPAATGGVVVIDTNHKLAAISAASDKSILAVGTAGDTPAFTDSPTVTTMYATTFDTNVAAAGVTLAGTTLAADGTDANIDINITSKGNGKVIINNIQLTTDLSVSDGGTGASTLTDHGVLVGSGTDPITALAVGATGEILTGVTGADPAWSSTPTVTTMYATTFDTNVASAGVTLSGTTLAADGTDANIPIYLTPKGTGTVSSSNGLVATSGNISATSGNIIATAGSVSASTTVTAGTTSYATTFDTKVAAAKLQISGTTIASTGNDADVDIAITTKGAGEIQFTTIEGGELSFRGIEVGFLATRWRTAQRSIQTTDMTITPIITIALPNSIMVSIKAYVNGFQNDYQEALGAEVFLTAYRSSASDIIIAGAPIINVNYSNLIDTSDVYAGIDTGTNTVYVSVQGTPDPWNWVTTFNYMYTVNNS